MRMMERRSPDGPREPAAGYGVGYDCATAMGADEVRPARRHHAADARPRPQAGAAASLPPCATADDLGRSLAAARRGGTLVGAAWASIEDGGTAWAVQAAAAQATLEAGVPQFGYTTLLLPVGREGDHGGLGDTLVHGPLFEDQLLVDLQAFPLPRGMLGVSPCLLVTMGRSFPVRGEEIGWCSATSAVAGCRLAMALLGRRTAGPLTAAGAIADFALHVATVVGPDVDWETAARAEGDVTMAINGHVLGRIAMAALCDRALAGLSGLALDLAVRGSRLEASDRVAAGARLPALQVLPGQHLRLEADGLGAVAVQLR